MKCDTLLELADRKPPFLCYAIARNRGVSFRTLVGLSGLSERTFCRIIGRPSWSGTKIEQIDSLCRACGSAPTRIESMNDYLRKTLKAQRPFRNLTRSMVRRVNQLATRWTMLRTNT